jgi:hypothetical protein
MYTHIFNRRNSRDEVARRKRSPDLTVDGLESRNLLSSIGAMALAVHTPVLNPAPILQVAEARTPKPTGQQAMPATAAESTTPKYTYFFFAFQFTGTGMENPHRTITAAQKVFSKEYGDKVQINSDGLHISVVRLGKITPSKAANDFSKAEDFVPSWINMNGHPNFHFRNKEGAKLKVKNDFVSYNVYLTNKSKKNFKKFAEDLAKFIGVKSTDAENKELHISILHYDAAESQIEKTVTSLNDHSDNYRLKLNFTPTSLVLMESVGKHQYVVAEVKGHAATIKI